MAVLLSILKITGIVLLIILLAFLAVVACILFVPVRYQGSGDIEAKKYKARISWMLGLIRVSGGTYRSGGASLRDIYSGKTYRNTGSRTAGKKERQKRKKAAKLIYHNNFLLLAVRIYPVTARKPPCLSTISTISMEHMTKKSVSDTFPK